jgi:hypothetical protein
MPLKLLYIFFANLPQPVLPNIKNERKGIKPFSYFYQIKNKKEYAIIKR